ncbi:hypothetical protein [Pedobacter sp.]
MNFKHLLLASVVISLFACQSNKTINSVQTDSLTFNNKVDTPIADSIMLERYFDYGRYTKFFKYKDKKNSAFAALEKDRDTSSLLLFLKNNISLISNNDPEWHYDNSTLLSSLFAIDLNGDGQKDIIYDGPTIGEGNVSHLIINNNGHFVKMFEARQNITHIKFVEGKMVKLFISNPGCCADASVVDYEYDVSYKTALAPVFSLRNSVGYTKSYEMPTKKYKAPVRFTATADRLYLRDCCFEYDGEHPMYGNNGNMIAIYPKHSTGVAIGEKVENGTVWALVLMNKENKITQTQFDVFTEQPTQVYGWVKKADINLN